MKHVFIGILLGSFYFLILLKTLPDYGMNQDSPGKFLRGQTYLQILTTGSDHFNQPELPSPVLFYPGQLVSLTLSNGYENRMTTVTPIRNPDPTKTVQQQFLDYQRRAGRQSIYKHNSFNLAYWNILDKGHPPVSDILMALANRIFYEKLGVLGDIEAYHIYSVFLASIAVLIVYAFTSSIWGIIPALMATVMLATYPLYFAESHFNIKDIPELTFYAGTLIGFYFWVTTSKLRWYLIFVSSFFLAFGTKWNILFIPFILVPWCWSIRDTELFRHWWIIRSQLALLLIFPISLVLLVLVWPYLWPSPLERMIEIAKFYLDESIPYTSGHVYWEATLFPFGYIFYYPSIKAMILAVSTAPLIVLVSLGSGAWYAMRSKVDRMNTGFFVLLWFLVPISKHALLHVRIASSIRQYMEFLPALAILAGLGTVNVLTWLTTTRKHYAFYVPLLGIVLYSAVLVRTLILTHPNQNVNFNSVFGGLSGAIRLFHLDYQTNYTNPYKQAAMWLNRNAEPNSKLAYIDGTMIGLSPMWLRTDISFGSHFSHVDRTGEYLITLAQINNANEFFYSYLERFLTPVHVIDVQGIPIVKIWRNGNEYVKKNMKSFQDISAFSIERDQTTGGLYWSIDFGSAKKLVSVTMTIPESGCEKHNLKQMDMFWFELTGRTFSPYIVERNPTTYDILFPAEETSKVRFDDIKHFGDTTLSSCFYLGTVTNIRVLKQ